MRGNWLAIVLTSVLALALTLMPAPDAYARHAPQWLLLTTLYWCIQRPNQVGLFYAWMMGLMMDVATSGLLGANALLFTLSAAVTLGLQRLLVFSGPLQQALYIAGLSLLYLAVSLWVQGGPVGATGSVEYLSRMISNLAAWPLLMLVFALIRQQTDRTR